MASLTYRKTLNSARIGIRISPAGPFLVKAKETLNPTRPDMEFVRMATGYGRESIYLPGSSLKGLTRANIESLVATAEVSPRVPICDPLDIRGSACGGTNSRKNQGFDYREPLRYEDHCDACKMFGSTEMAGRFRFGDLFPWRPNADDAGVIEAIAEIEEFIGARTSVAISRDKGQAKGGALFDMEYVSGGHFYGEVVAHNYSLWQLGLLQLLFARIDDGTLRMGFGKSRGFGKVRLSTERMTIDQYGVLASDEGLCGAEDGESAIAAPVASQRDPLGGRRYVIEGDAVDELWPALFEALADHFK